MPKTIQELRRERGYRSAREFADALGISPSSMSRYDNQPESIPTKVAWEMADKLGCSIDEVVGRKPVASGRSELQELYDGLLPETRQLVDEFLEFARLKDERERADRQAEEDRKYDRLCEFHERMFRQSLYDSAEFGDLVAFDSPEQERGAFERFLRDKAAEKRKPGVDEELEEYEDAMRETWPESDTKEEDIRRELEKARKEVDQGFGKKDEEVISKIMSAYDRLHRRELRNWAVHSGEATPIGIEYSSVRLPK